MQVAPRVRRRRGRSVRVSRRAHRVRGRPRDRRGESLRRSGHRLREDAGPEPGARAQARHASSLMGRPVVVGLSQEEHARKGARRPDGHARNDGGLGRGIGRCVRAWRVDGAGTRRPRDRRGPRGCSCRRTGNGDRVTIELHEPRSVRTSRLPRGRATARPALSRRLWADLDDNADSSDDIEETVDYRRLAELVSEVFAGPSSACCSKLWQAPSPKASSNASHRSEARPRARPQAGRRARSPGGARGGHR